MFQTPITDNRTANRVLLACCYFFLNKKMILKTEPASGTTPLTRAANSTISASKK
jgi:hypothetical protein